MVLDVSRAGGNQHQYNPMRTGLRQPVVHTYICRHMRYICQQLPRQTTLCGRAVLPTLLVLTGTIVGGWCTRLLVLLAERESTEIPVQDKLEIVRAPELTGHAPAASASLLNGIRSIRRSIDRSIDVGVPVALFDRSMLSAGRQALHLWMQQYLCMCKASICVRIDECCPAATGRGGRQMDVIGLV